MPKGLDVGTNTIVCAKSTGVELQRDAFLSLDGMQTSKAQLKKMGISYIELNNKIYIIGTEANGLATMFNNSELRRPLKNGMLNPQEQDALPILGAIIKNLLGDNNAPNEICVFSVPAPPIDAVREIAYHEEMCKIIIENCGYSAVALNEAVALSNVGLEDSQFTGISVSMGAGLTNIAIMYRGMPALTFSINKGGDYIDEMVSKETGVTSSIARQIKEKNNFSISNDAIEIRSREQNAVKTYYEAYIRYILNQIEFQFTKNTNMPNFADPVPFVIGGGGCMVNGFIEVFKEQFSAKGFPLKISEIRLVKEPLTAVSRGCLIEAELQSEE